MMKIGFIGAGKVGFTLGQYFFHNGLTISGYLSQTTEHAKQAASLTASQYFLDIEKIVQASDLLLITTTDQEISKIWLQIKKLEIKNKIFCHCSGSLSSEIFFEAEELGAFAYSLHPMFAINDKLASYKNLKLASFTLEGSNEHLTEIKELISALGNNVQIISSEKKVKYHAANVLSSNLVLGLFKMSTDMLKECGFTEEQANQALKPLFWNNVQKLVTTNLQSALTGPIERNDLKTVEKHLQILKPEEKIVYQELSKNLVKIAQNKNPQKDYDEMIKLLS